MIPAPNDAKKLGAFVGVFTPSVLTILGLILFLRTGYVVGWGGLGQTLAILLIATAVSVLTSVSLSAIATNLRVKKGGVYYLISRTLGPEFGGSIGAVLFLAQAISVAFYCVGFAEAMTAVCGFDHPQAVRLISMISVVVLFGLAWMGSDWASKLQLVIMVVLGIALIGFFAGALPHWNSQLLAGSWARAEGGPGFWLLFAIFFPAVTGFTQGAAMSGDLRNPSKALPLGTFWAVGLSTVIYLAVIVVFAATASGASLRDDSSIMRSLALRPWLVDAGVISATLSSALASFLGAPRILQSLAQDKTIRVLNRFGAGSGPTENPRAAVALTMVIALGVTAVGEINLIAPVVSMFFLLSYGLLNYATWFDATTGSPSFRPTFRYFNRWLSLAGAGLCAMVMLIVDPIPAIAAGAMLFGLYQFLQRTAGPARWADSARSYSLRLVRKHLFAVAQDAEHVRDWRPHVLAFSDDAARRDRLLTFAEWIEGGVGITTAVRIVVGEGASGRKKRLEADAILQKEVKASERRVFALAVLAPDLITGARQLLQSWGIGPVRANLLLLNWLEQASAHPTSEREQRYGEALQTALRLHRNVVALEADDDEWRALTITPRKNRRIDVWWFDDASSRLALLLAYLMTRTEDWDEAEIRLCVAVGEGAAESAVEDARQMLDDIRIEADVLPVESVDAEAIVRDSADATIVLCPFRVRHGMPCDRWGGAIEPLVSRLPVIALVIAGEELDLSGDPDAGEAAIQAADQDRLDSDLRRAELLEVRAAEIATAAEKEIAILESTAVGGGGDLTTEQREAKIAELRGQVQEASRRAIKARARINDPSIEDTGDAPVAQ